MAGVFGAQFGARFGAKFGANNLWGPLYPATGTAFAAQTGITLDSLYTFQEASGDLDDKAGSSDLPVAGSPTFAATIGGRQGVTYGAASAAHRGAVYPPGTSSQLAFVVCANPGAATGGVFGNYDQSDALDGWGVYRDTNNFLLFVRSSAAGGNLSATASSTTIQSDTLYLVSVQIDQAADIARMRIKSASSAAEQVQVSVATLGTLTGTSNNYGFGALAFLQPGVSCFYGGIVTGSAAEGSSVLANLHRALGWE